MILILPYYRKHCLKIYEPNIDIRKKINNGIAEVACFYFLNKLDFTTLNILHEVGND